MTYIVNDKCIKCKLMDCVEVCPVDCFYEGENMLVIHPDECIDCGVCEPECPLEAILPDTEPDISKWLEINNEYSAKWPNINRKGEPPADSDEWRDKPNKAELFSENPGQGT
ncbi:MAG: ferredoxin family protein [Rhodospirillales bacterium]|nr:ferredoxin family protein [Rhodospirillales bacterium]